MENLYFSLTNDYLVKTSRLGDLIWVADLTVSNLNYYNKLFVSPDEEYVIVFSDFLFEIYLL